MTRSSAVINKAVPFVTVLLFLSIRVATCSSAFAQLEYKLPRASPEYERTLRETQDLAAAVRLQGLALQKDVDSYNERMEDVKQHMGPRFPSFRRRRPIPKEDMDAFTEFAKSERSALQTRMKQLNKDTDTLKFELAKLSGHVLNKESNMERHQSAAPALRATIKWLVGLGETDLRQVPTRGKS